MDISLRQLTYGFSALFYLKCLSHTSCANNCSSICLSSLVYLCKVTQKKGVKRSFASLCGNGTNGTSVGKKNHSRSFQFSDCVVWGRPAPNDPLPPRQHLQRREGKVPSGGKGRSWVPHGGPCGLSPSYLSLGYGTSLASCLSPERTALQLSLDQVLTVLPKSMTVLAPPKAMVLRALGCVSVNCSALSTGNEYTQGTHHLFCSSML